MRISDWSSDVCSSDLGLEDRVEWHWRRILAGAAFSTLTGVGAELVAPSRDDPDGTVIVATRQGLQDTANQVGQQVTRRNFDLQPTLPLRAGFPVRVMVSQNGRASGRERVCQDV